jgi:flagellar hook-associated protein 2
MDTDTVIQKLLALERAPRRQMEFGQSVSNARKSGLGVAQEKLKSLQLAGQSLSSVVTWAPSQTVASSDATKVTATLNGGAAPGGYLIEVAQMATSTQKTFDFARQAGQTTITVGAAAVTLDPDATIDDAVAAINAEPSLGVYAVNIGNDKLVLSSRTTGAASGFTVTGAGLTADTGTPDRLGQDAVMTVNGQTVTSSSNAVTARTITSGSPIPGVDFTLRSVTDGTTLTVSPPGTDRSALKDRLKAFVSAYNGVIDSLRAMTSEQTVKNPSSSGEAAKGALFGDTGRRNVLSSLRRLFGSPVQNATTFTTLAAIGVSTGKTTGDGTLSDDAVAGRLTFDESTLDAALDKDPLAVQRLLGGTAGVPGFAQSLDDLVTPLVQPGGVFGQRMDSAGRTAAAIGDSMTRLDARLTSREDMLRRQFAAMEQAMADSQSQQQQLLSKLALPSRS